MTTEKKNTKYVVLMFISIALVVFSSIVVDQELIDILYFVLIIFYFIRYLLLIRER